eukprot:868424-Pelagomonas_calceolata.AAC.1
MAPGTWHMHENSMGTAHCKFAGWHTQPRTWHMHGKSMGVAFAELLNGTYMKTTVRMAHDTSMRINRNSAL